MNEDVIMFEGVGRCFYTLGEMQAPKAGQFFVTSSPHAQKAFRDYPPGEIYRIVIPTHMAYPVQSYVRGDPVDARGNVIPRDRAFLAFGRMMLLTDKPDREPLDV